MGPWKQSGGNERTKVCDGDANWSSSRASQSQLGAGSDLTPIALSIPAQEAMQQKTKEQKDIEGAYKTTSSLGD